jgi:hypothetical protein
MPRLHAPRALLAIVGVAALSLTAGCLPCLPGGSGGGGGGGCINPTSVTLGTPFTICLPESSSRVSVTVTGLSGDTPVEVSCDVGATNTNLTVKTANANNFSCGSWGTNSAATRTIPASNPTVEFGIDSYPTGAAPGTATITITPDHP